MLKSTVKYNGHTINNESKYCFLCDTINEIHEHYNISSFLKNISQWDIKGSSQMRFIQNFQCYVCNFNANNFILWKQHILSVEHTSKSHSTNILYSYSCGACKLLLYGSKLSINNHRFIMHNDTSNLPNISIIMAELMKNIYYNSKHFYVCNHLKTSSETSCDVTFHKNKFPYYCKYCHVTFTYSMEVLDCHFLSVEHVTLKCIYFIKEAIKVNTLEKRTQIQTTIINDLNTKTGLLNLPLIISNRYEKISRFLSKCKLCNTFVYWSTKEIFEHSIYECPNKSYISSNMHKTTIQRYDCKVCLYTTHSFFDYKNHVISPIHLRNCCEIDNLYSYFCTICNLYLYSSKNRINDHQKDIHNKITAFPMISIFLANNYEDINNINDLDIVEYIDYYDGKASTTDNLYSCHVCKINFYMNVNDYNLHKISSEHIILKYFTQKNPRLIIENCDKPLKPKTSINTNLITNNEVSNHKHTFSEKTCVGKKVQEVKINKGQINSKNELFVDNMLITQGKNDERELYSVMPLNNTNNSDHENTNLNINTDQIVENLTKLKPTTITEVSSTRTSQGTISYSDISTSTDDLGSKTMKLIKCKLSDLRKLKKIVEIMSNNLINQELFVKNTKGTQTKRSSSEIKSTDIDEVYGQYVTQRLDQIHDASVKSALKLEIDFIFYIKLIQLTKCTTENQ